MLCRERDGHIAGQVVFFEAREVIEDLLLGANKVPASVLLLDQENALPEEIDEPALIAQA